MRYKTLILDKLKRKKVETFDLKQSRQKNTDYVFDI
jgi:hypothetical protein